MEAATIPRLDAGALARGERAAMATLRRAATETGFLTLHGTAIPAARVAGLIDAYRGFFHAPEAAKAAVDMAATGSNRGWGRSRAERVDPSANPDLKEVFDVGLEMPGGGGHRYHAPNLWPEGQAGFRGAVEGYFAAALGVAGDLLGAVAASLGEPRDSFAGAFERPMALLRANWYPPRPGWAADRDYGIAPHTDYGCLTLLATDGSPGLEVRMRDGGWAAVAPPPGEFVVNFGEMLERWSDGRIVATPHRVVGTAAERISVPLFYNPSFDADVSGTGEAPLLAGDHLSRRYDETYLHLGGGTGG